MLTHPTLDTLRALKLDGMAEAFTELQTQDGSADLIPTVIDQNPCAHLRPACRGT